MDIRGPLATVAWMFDGLDQVTKNLATLDSTDQLAAWDVVATWLAAGRTRAWAAKASEIDGRATAEARADVADLDACLDLKAGTARHKLADAAVLAANPTLLGSMETGGISPQAAVAVATQLRNVPSADLAEQTQKVLDTVTRAQGKHAPVTAWTEEAKRVVDSDAPAAASARRQRRSTPAAWWSGRPATTWPSWSRR